MRASGESPDRAIFNRRYITEQDKWGCAVAALMIYYDKPLIMAPRNGNRYPSLSSLQTLPIFLNMLFLVEIVEAEGRDSSQNRYVLRCHWYVFPLSIYFDTIANVSDVANLIINKEDRFSNISRGHIDVFYQIKL